MKISTLKQNVALEKRILESLLEPAPPKRAILKSIFHARAAKSAILQSILHALAPKKGILQSILHAWVPRATKANPKTQKKNPSGHPFAKWLPPVKPQSVKSLTGGTPNSKKEPRGTKSSLRVASLALRFNDSLKRGVLWRSPEPFFSPFGVPFGASGLLFAVRGSPG